MAQLSIFIVFFAGLVMAPATFADATPFQTTKTSSSAAHISEVVIYSASWCVHCAKAKAYLTKRDIKYQEISIETDAGLASLANIGGQGVPLLLIGNHMVQGFSSGKYDEFFANLQ